MAPCFVFRAFDLDLCSVPNNFKTNNWNKKIQKVKKKCFNRQRSLMKYWFKIKIKETYKLLTLVCQRWICETMVSMTTLTWWITVSFPMMIANNTAPITNLMIDKQCLSGLYRRGSRGVVSWTCDRHCTGAEVRFPLQAFILLQSTWVRD